MHYQSYGKGAPVVLLHGFCETGQVWDGFYGELATDHQILIPDLPGFGRSDLLPDGFDITDVAEAVFQWLRSLNIDQVVVIGHSLGGYVSLALARLYPEMIAGLGLFHSTAFADSAEKKETRNKVIDFVRANGVEVFADSFIPQLFYVKNRDRLKEEIGQTVRIACSTPSETLISYTRAMRDREDRTDVLKTLEAPVLFIAGDQDTSVPVGKSREQIPMIKNSFAKILRDTGHMGMFEAREEALEQVEEFLRSTTV